MQRAVNPQTGEVLFLVDNQWVPPAQTAKNDKGEIAYLVGNQWEIVPGIPAAPISQKPAPAPAPTPTVASTAAPTPVAVTPKPAPAPAPALTSADDYGFGNPSGDDLSSAIMAAATPKKKSVLEGREMPAPLPTEDRYVVDPKFINAVQAVLDATPEDKRQAALAKMAERPDVYGRAARAIAGRYEQQDKVVSQTARNATDLRIEQQTKRFIDQGMDPEVAKGLARNQALSGQVRPNLDQMRATPQEVQAGRELASNSRLHGIDATTQALKRAGVKTVMALGQAGGGMQMFMGDLLGLDTSDKAETLGKINAFTQAMGEPAEKPIAIFESALSSIGQQLPALVGGVATGSSALTLASMFANSFGQEYEEGRRGKLDFADSTARAAVMAAFEVIGEKFGLKESLGAIKQAAKGVPTDQLAKFFAITLKKEAPGELLTYAGQYATNMGYGMQPEAGLEHFFKGAMDTVLTTVAQGGIMAGGRKAITVGAQKLLDKVNNTQPLTEEEKAEFEKLVQSIKDEQAGKEKIKGEKEPAAVVTKESTEEKIKEAAAQLERRGFDPADALRIATIRFGETPEGTETNAPIKEGAEDVTKPISEAGGESPAVSTQSTDNVPPAEGLGDTKRDGVVLTGQDVSESAEGKGSKPAPITDADVTNTVTYFEKRDELTKQLDAVSEESSALLDKLLDLDSIRAADVLDDNGKPLVLDENGNYDSDKKYEAVKALEAKRKEASAKFDAIIKQLDELDAAREAALKTKTPLTFEERLQAENKTKGETVGPETTETVQTTQEGQTTSTAGAVSKGKRGRPKAAITEEQRAEKEKARTEGRAEYMKGERALAALQTKLDEANAPIDETNIADEESLRDAENEKRAHKRAHINALMDLKEKHGNSALGNRVKAVLADRSKISQKEIDDVTAGRKYLAKERVNKSSASNDEVEAADEGFKNAKNASQALGQVIKTGTNFQKYLAKRLRRLVAGVNFVVVEENDPLPEQLARHQEAWGNDNSRARGVYFENTATGERTIFVRGASAGSFQGINNTTVLHEALHAALQQKLELALLAVQRGFSGDAKLVRAYNDLIAVMNNAKDEYNRLANLGELPAEMFYLKTVSGVFSNPHEFVSYGMTDPFFQKFLMGAYGFEEETGLFNRFVDAIREMLGMDTDTVNALSDLIVVTDKLMSSKLTPTMKMIAKADKANAIREARVGKVYAQTPAMPQQTGAQVQETQADIEAKVQKALGQIQAGENAEEIAKNASLLQSLRSADKILPALNRLWNSFTYKQRKYVLAPLPIDVVASWGSSYVPEIANTNVLMQRMTGMTNLLLESAADISTDAMRVFAKNPGEQTKLKRVALAATLQKIDPADASATRRSAILDKMYNELTPDGKRVYKEMRDHMNDMTDYYMLLLQENIDSSGIEAEGKALIMARIKQVYEASKRITPYFALTREGPYWLSVGKGEKREFYMRPSMNERDALAEELALEKGIDVTDIVMGNDINELRKSTYQKSDLLKDVFAAIDATSQTDPKAKENLKDAVYELYLRTMPENSFRGQFIERKNITGFSTDVLRSFNETAIKMALQLSKLKYGPQLRTSISAAKDSIKGQPTHEPFIKEMERRIESELNPRIRNGWDSIATFLNRAAAVTYLSGPSTALIQPISILQTGSVILGARHGYAKTAKELAKFSKFWDEYGISKKRLDGSTAWVMPTIENSKAIQLNEDERRAVREMRARAVTSSTYASEIFEFNIKSTEEVMSATEKAKVIAGTMTFGLLHSADRLTREVIYLASYRLGRSNGKTHEQAVDQAVIDTHESQGNFANYAKPLFMKVPGGRLAMQFTTYSLNISIMLIRNFYRMIVGLNGEGRAEAFKIFFGTLSSTALIGGVTALPMFSITMALLSWIWNDKERPQELKDLDRETWFTQVYLPEKLGNVTLGGYKLGDLNDLVARGALNKLTGLDFSSRTSLNDIWWRDIKETASSRDSAIAYGLQRAGPSAAMILNWFDAYDAFKHGDSQKGFEKIAPAFARNVILASKYKSEGVKDNKGAILAKPEAFTGWDLFGQGIGLRSDALANLQSTNFKLMAVDKKVDLERTGLLNDLDRVDRNGDTKGYREVSKEIDAFNKKYPTRMIDLDVISGSLDKRREARAMSWRGIQINEQNEALLDRGAQHSRKLMREKEAANKAK
jgi:hypothetical protein